MDILLLLIGLALILAGANFLTDGSAALAQRFRVPEFIIGLTIVAVGTSTPSWVVSVLGPGRKERRGHRKRRRFEHLQRLSDPRHLRPDPPAAPYGREYPTRHPFGVATSLLLLFLAMDSWYSAEPSTASAGWTAC